MTHHHISKEFSREVNVPRRRRRKKITILQKTRQIETAFKKSFVSNIFREMDVHLDSFTIIFPWFLIVFLALYGLYQRIGEVEETILYQLQSTNAVQGAEGGERETEEENYEYYN